MSPSTPTTKTTDADKPRISRDALLGAGATVLAAVVSGLFGLIQLGPTVTGEPSTGTLEAENHDLRTEVDNLTATNRTLTTNNSALKDEVESLELKLASRAPSAPPSSPPPATDEPSVYQDVPYTLTYSLDGARAAFVDLDNRLTDTMLYTEWEETAESGGPIADLAIDEWNSGIYYLVWSRTGTWNSEISAPTTTPGCHDAAAGTDGDPYVKIRDLTEGDVICLTTTEGATARLTISKINTENSPRWVEFTATLWE